MSAVNLNNVLNLADLFREVHGYTPAKIAGMPTTIDLGPQAQVQPVTRKTENLYGQPYYQKDMLGQEVFCPMTIDVDGKDYFFPYTVMGFSRALVTVETEMTELGGSIDEIISLSDFAITMRGFLMGQYGQFPDDEITMLNDVMEAAKVVRLKSAYSDLYLRRNDNILIKKMDAPETTGVIGVRPFALQAKSSNIFTLNQD